MYARNRLRNEVLPVLREIGPEVEATIAETQAELAEESEALERAAAEVLSESGAGRRRARSAATCSRRSTPRSAASRFAASPSEPPDPRCRLGRDRADRRSGDW